MTELHLQAGTSEFSAGFQSVLATDDNRAIVQFFGIENDPSPSKSIGVSSVSENEADQTTFVLRALMLNKIPADEILEQLNPVLAAEKERMEAQELMPLVKAELMTVDWSQHCGANGDTEVHN